MVLVDCQQLISKHEPFKLFSKPYKKKESLPIFPRPSPFPYLELIASPFWCGFQQYCHQERFELQILCALVKITNNLTFLSFCVNKDKVDTTVTAVYPVSPVFRLAGGCVHNFSFDKKQPQTKGN